MTTALTVFLFLLVLYLTLSLIFTYLAQQWPRKAVVDRPDWGTVTDTWVPTVGGGRLETWRIEPDGPSVGTVVFVHGWGRNRDRMVGRARIFAGWGFTTVLFSARDHGNSTRRRFMNAVKFAEDTAAVLDWLDEPVVLYGHSAGSAAAVVAASRRPGRVRLLFLEGAYADTREALMSLYRWINPWFGRCFGPAIIAWMNLFYRNGLDRVSPERLAPSLHMPVMLVHGENDRRFPLAFARRLAAGFRPGQAELYVASGAGHSDSSQTAGYAEAVQAFLARNHAILTLTQARNV